VPEQAAGELPYRINRGHRRLSYRSVERRVAGASCKWSGNSRLNQNGAGITTATTALAELLCR
jgi:N-acetyl-anhydromuramyl-L-alanine amidase AmpD